MDLHAIESADNLLERGKTHLLAHELDKALEVIRQSLKTSQLNQLNNQEIEAKLLIGKIHISKKEYVHAITPLLVAKEKSHQIQNLELLGQSILQIGVLYNRVFHYPKALENLYWVKENYWESLNLTDQILLLNYLGKSHFLSFENEAAEEHFAAAVQLAKQQQDKRPLAFAYAYLGRLYTIRKNFKKALIFAKKTNDIIEKTGDTEGVQVNLINLGDIHSQLEKYSEGIKLASRGIAAAKRMKDEFYEIRGYQIMAEIFRKKKDYKNAVMYQMIYTKFYEDFYQRNDRQKISEIESQFTIQQLRDLIEQLKSGSN